MVRRAAGNKKDLSNPKEIRVAKITATQVVICSVVTSLTSILITLLSTGAFKSSEPPAGKDKSTPQSVVAYPNFKTQKGQIINVKELKNEGLEILSNNTVMDLSSRVIADSEVLDTLRVSPAIQTTKIKFIRRTEDAKYFVQRFASQRKLMDISSLSHRNFEVAYFSGEEVAKTDRIAGLDNQWYLIIDISQHHINLEQELTFRAVRWNAYQAANGNYWSRLIVGEEGVAIITVIIPNGKTFKTKPTYTIQLAGQTTAEKSFEPNPSDILLADTYCSWRINNPKPNHLYKVIMDLEDINTYFDVWKTHENSNK
jgi:hypothetical protein